MNTIIKVFPFLMCNFEALHVPLAEELDVPQAGYSYEYVDWQLCNVTQMRSNLGGMGPDKGEKAIRFTNVSFDDDGGGVDLVIVNTSEYIPKNVSVNAEHGCLGQINILANTTVWLKFKWVKTGTWQPTEKKNYYFSVFDIDSGGKATEVLVFPTSPNELSVPYYTYFWNSARESPQRRKKEKNSSSIWSAAKVNGWTIMSAYEGIETYEDIDIYKNPKDMGDDSLQTSFGTSWWDVNEIEIGFSVYLRDENQGSNAGRNFFFCGWSLLSDCWGCNPRDDYYDWAEGRTRLTGREVVPATNEAPAPATNEAPALSEVAPVRN